MVRFTPEQYERLTGEKWEPGEPNAIERAMDAAGADATNGDRRVAGIVATERNGKYNNRWCRDEVFGTDRWFQSQLERDRYYMLMADPDVVDLQCQVPFDIYHTHPAGRDFITTYVADFVYMRRWSFPDPFQLGVPDDQRRRVTRERRVVEDAKGVVTEVFRIKYTLMRVLMHINVELWPPRKLKTRAPKRVDKPGGAEL